MHHDFDVLGKGKVPKSKDGTKFYCIAFRSFHKHVVQTLWPCHYICDETHYQGATRRRHSPKVHLQGGTDSDSANHLFKSRVLEFVREISCPAPPVVRERRQGENLAAHTEPTRNCRNTLLYITVPRLLGVSSCSPLNVVCNSTTFPGKEVLSTLDLASFLVMA